MNIIFKPLNSIAMMKKFMMAIAGIVLCLTANAQVNPMFTELEDYLQEQGIEVFYSQRNKGEWIDHERSASFWINHYRDFPDSVMALRNKPLQMAMDSIRRTFSVLSTSAAESYMYEYHRGQRDTIEYSIAFAGEEGNSALSFKHNNAVSFRNMREVGRLHYNNTFLSADTFGNARYWHHYYEQNPLTWEQLQDFDAEGFQKLIEPFFQAALKEKGVKSYPIYWRHDEGYTDSVYWSRGKGSDKETSGGLQFKYTLSHDDDEENKHTGMTTGTHYLIPKEKEMLALELLHRLDSISFAYVNAHPEQVYNYHRYNRYYKGSWGTLVSGTVHYRNKGRGYELNCFLDEDGFHIVSIVTLGEMWMPRDWTKLKSWINGERIYFKGMKPKDSKK